MANNRLFSLVLALSLFVADSATCVDGEKPFTARLLYESVTFSGHLSNGEYEFSVGVKLVNRDSGQVLETSSKDTCWGLPDTGSVTVVDKLRLVVSGEEHHVPPQAITGLFDVDLTNGIHVGEAQDSIFVYLIGGRGKHSYNMVLSFFAGRAIHRRIEYTSIDGQWLYSSQEF